MPTINIATIGATGGIVGGGGGGGGDAVRAITSNFKKYAYILATAKIFTTSRQIRFSHFGCIYFHSL